MLFRTDALPMPIFTAPLPCTPLGLSYSFLLFYLFSWKMLDGCFFFFTIPMILVCTNYIHVETVAKRSLKQVHKSLSTTTLLLQSVLTTQESIIMQRKKIIPLLLKIGALALITCGVSTAQAASITYSIIDNPSVENGWTVSGTITTDGTLGTLSRSNILSWAYTFTKGATVESWSSSDPTAASAVEGLVATSTQLILPGNVPNNEVETLSLSYSGGTDDQLFLVWERAGPSSGRFGGPAYDQYYGQDHGGTNTLWSTDSPGTSLSSDWVIGTEQNSPVVPEPSTLVFATFGFGAIIIRQVRAYRRRCVCLAS